MSITTPQSSHLTNVKSSSNFFTIIIIIVAIILLVVIISVIKWFIKQRRLRELRHRLIPMYTFDPNDEDDWDSELLCQDQSFVVQKNQDYNSVRNGEGSDLSLNRQSLI